MTSDPNPPSGPSREPVEGYEKRDANARWIVGIVIFLFAFGLAIQGILAGYLIRLKRIPPPTDRWRPLERAARAPPSFVPPFPRLQVSPPADLQAFRAREEAQLHGYGWINRTSGIVHIPIEQAMDLVLRQGLPVRSQTNKSQAGPSSYQLIQQRPEHREPEIQGEK